MTSPINPDGSLKSDWGNTDPMLNDHPGHHNYIAAKVNAHDTQLSDLQDAVPATGATGSVLVRKSADPNDTEWKVVVPPASDGDAGDVLTVVKATAGVAKSMKWREPTGGSGETAIPSIVGNSGDILGVITSAGQEKLAWVEKGETGAVVPDPTGKNGEVLTSDGSAGPYWDRKPRIWVSNLLPDPPSIGENGDIWVQF